MARIKDEKISDTSLNGHDANHGPNHRPKVEFRSGGCGGRGDRFLPYGGQWTLKSKSRMEMAYNVWYEYDRAVRYLMNGISRDNNMSREEFLKDYYHGDNPQADNDIMHRSNRNHSKSGRRGGVGGVGRAFRCG